MNFTRRKHPIVIAYDGSEGAQRAIAVAGQLTGGGSALVCNAWVGASELLLRADASGLGPPLAHGVDDLDRPDAEAAERIAAEGARLARAAGFDAQPLAVHEHENAWRSVVGVAARRGARMIVVGAHGRSGLRALLGSVSRGIVHHASMPVLVVPSGAGDAGLDAPALLAYDGSQAATHAIGAAAALLAVRRAVVFHAWESWVAEAPALAGVSHSVRGMAVELDEIADRQSSELVAAGEAAAAAAGFRAVTASAETGAPLWRAILDAADDARASAIVVGTRGMTGISAALGSVSRGVVHHSRRPVLVVPPATR